MAQRNEAQFKFGKISTSANKEMLQDSESYSQNTQADSANTQEVSNLSVQYNGLSNFVSDTKTIQDFILTSDILNNLFSLYEAYNYHFITISTNEAEPFARANEILCVAKEATPQNAQIIIAQIQQSVIFFEYFVLNENEVILKGADGITRHINNDEFSNIKILGVVKNIISFR